MVPEVGKLIPDGAIVHRDAIHVAVAPMVAGESLAPGGNVVIDGRGKAVAGPDAIVVGIVDPFLDCSVKEGERFWLFLTPGTITDLRHVWSHPAFRAVASPLQPEPETEVNVLDLPTSELKLSVRGRKCMLALNIKTIGDLANHSEEDLWKVKNFGMTTLVEVKQALKRFGLKLKGDGD